MLKLQDVERFSTMFIGTSGAVSVFRAVYVQKRGIKCACVGGGSNVPLGFVSLADKPGDDWHGSADAGAPPRSPESA